MNLRRQLSLALTAVTGTALLISFATVVVLVRRDEMRDLDNALAEQAAATVQLVRAHGEQHPERLVRPAELPETLQPTKRFIAVYDAAGRLVAQSDSFRGQAPMGENVGVRPDGEVRAVDLKVAEGQLRGVLVPIGRGAGQTLLYAAFRRSVDDDIAFLLRVMAGLFVGAMVLTALVARWLGGFLVRDVAKIAEVARKVAHGQLETRAGAERQSSDDARALATDLDHMIERLSALMAAQRTFVSHAAHELRSPLATIRGEMQLALRRPRSQAEYREAIEAALLDVEALSQLAEDLLTLARAESAPVSGDSTTVAAAVGEALRMARGAAKARSVSIARDDGAAAELCVPGPTGEIARVLRNLIDNAVAHSPNGGQVRVVAASDGAEVELSVTDEGAGVSPTDAPHIFSPFFRSSKDRGSLTEEVGAGLGLSIARQIARRYGGDVWLDDGQTRSGARFVFKLPVVEPPSSRTSLEAEPSSAAEAG